VTEEEKGPGWTGCILYFLAQAAVIAVGVSCLETWDLHSRVAELERDIADIRGALNPAENPNIDVAGQIERALRPKD
jgi:hypothetical protein